MLIGLVLAGTFSTERVSLGESSMIAAASASSDGGGEEGGGEEGGGEEEGGSEEGSEDGADDQVEDGEGGERLTFTPDLDDFPQLIPPSSPKTLTLPTNPGSQLSTLQSLCLINPNHPQCQSTSTSLPLGSPLPTIPQPTLVISPTPTPVLPQSLCLINPNHPQCQSTSSSIPLGTTPAPGKGLFSPNIPDIPPLISPSFPTVTLPTDPGSQSSTLQSQCIINPNHPQCQSTQSNIGDLASPSSPDTLFSGPKSAPGGSGVPLRDPVLVPAPSEEGTAEEPCVGLCPPYEYDEICRNGKDDDFDGKVDEAYPCREVPGESKPRPSDGILTEIPGSSLGPPQN